MIRKILFATDLGAFTAHALLHVDLLARQFNAKVVVVHAVPPFGELAAAVVRSHCSAGSQHEVLDEPELNELLEGIREGIFERLMSQEFADLGIEQWIDNIVVAPGNAAAVVLEQADWLRSDLIVVGSHTPEALDGRLLGSVAAKILQLSKVPVLLIPMAKDPFGMRWGYPSIGGDDSSHFGT